MPPAGLPPPLLVLFLLALPSSAAPAPLPAPPTRPTRLESVRIHAEQLGVNGVREATVFGDGIAILANQGQIRLEPAEVRRLLEAFEEADFAGMPPFFGAGRKRLLRRASLRADGARKEVVQLLAGDESPALARLVDRILVLVEERAGSALTASDLSDGLRKVAAGAVAPEAFWLQVQRKPRSPASDAAGYLLSVEEGVATTRLYAHQRYEDAVSLTLGRDRLAKLASALAAHDPESLPVNLYAPEYLEVRLNVLQWTKGVLAMPFAGTTPATHGEAQARFDRLSADLDALQQEVLADGQRNATHEGSLRQQGSSAAVARVARQRSVDP